MLEKSTESIMEGEKDKHMDHREHQIRIDTGVKGAKRCIKANINAISSDTHQLQFIKLHHFKRERY